MIYHRKRQDEQLEHTARLWMPFCFIIGFRKCTIAHAHLYLRFGPRWGRHGRPEVLSARFLLLQLLLQAGRLG